MSVAFFETNSNNNNSDCNNSGCNRIIQLPAMWIYTLSESNNNTNINNNMNSNNNMWSNTLPVVKEEEYSDDSSSIGCDSDDGGDGEVESKDGGNDGNGDGIVNGPLNGLNELEAILPIKRGISSFYAGKSKSYGSLADAVSVPSIQDIVKPEDAYSRKRKNMIAHHVLLDKHSESATGKRLARNSNDSERSTSTVGRSLPPLPPKGRRPPSAKESSVSAPRLYMRSPWRSLSLSDLQHASSFNGVSNNGTKVDGH